MLKENKYCNYLATVESEYESILDVIDMRYDQLNDEYGEGSDELRAFLKAKSNVKSPFSYGQETLLRSWRKSCFDDEIEMLEVRSIWASEIGDFTEAMDEAGLDQFVLLDSSSALMGLIHGLTQAGWKMAGVYTRDCPKMKKTLEGIRFIKL